MDLGEKDQYMHRESAFEETCVWLTTTVKKEV